MTVVLVREPPSPLFLFCVVKCLIGTSTGRLLASLVLLVRTLSANF